MSFELTNNQREYFGLDQVETHWDKIALNGDTYRPQSILYFDRDTIKKHITSTDEQYREVQYNELTKSRNILLPKTDKGREKKLTASVLEARQPTGVYCEINAYGKILIGNFDTQTTFYNSKWESNDDQVKEPIYDIVEKYIRTSSTNYIAEIEQFKVEKRKNCKFKTGDFFTFKISRTKYGFGRILLNFDELKTKNLFTKDHGLSFLMGKPLLVKIYAFISDNINVTLDRLEDANSLPSDYVMDNGFFYGQFQIIGYKKLLEADFDFPMSYGRHINFSKHCSFYNGV